MKNKTDREKMEKDLLQFGLELTDAQLEAFDQYYDLLVEWNQFMNLTGITDYKEVLLKHFVDSLCIQKAVDLKGSEPLKIIDVGTGAGFPGLPIKIAFPQHQVTLLDSLNKRIKFLDEVIAQTGLRETETIHARAEDAAMKEAHRSCYDLAVSRAVANLSTLSEYCLPFVKKGGYFVAYKSGEFEQELAQADKALKILGAKVKNQSIFTLPDSDIRRSLIVIEKIADTPKKYPRKAGLPSREPLK